MLDRHDSLKPQFADLKEFVDIFGKPRHKAALGLLLEAYAQLEEIKKQEANPRVRE